METMDEYYKRTIVAIDLYKSNFHGYFRYLQIIQHSDFIRYTIIACLSLQR